MVMEGHLSIKNGELNMKLGILVNTSDHLAAINGIVKSATAKEHEVYIFAMDEGTRLLEAPEYVSLVELPGVVMSYCDHSAQELNVNTEGLSSAIERSSQYSNAEMNHYSDKVLVL
jgi:predicted peroxiredoxin